MHARPSAVALAVLVAFAAAPAFAEYRGGETVVIASDETIEGNLYVSGGTVSLRGQVRGDLVVLGGTLLLDGYVGGDLVAAGGQVTMSGTVDGDVRAAGGQLLLLGPVRGDVALVGGELSLSAPVGRDALLAGGSASIEDSIGGDLIAGVGQTTIDARVGGDVKAQGGYLELEEHARVGGDVSFAGSAPVATAAGAVVDGTIEYRAVAEPDTFGSLLYGFMQVLVGLAVLGLLWLFLFRGFALRSTEALREHPGKALLLGVAAFVLTPLVLLLVLGVGVLVGGAWLALVGGAIYGIALALTFPLVATFLGLTVLHALGRREVRAWWPMLVSLVLLLALMVVPFLGPLLALGVMLFGLGAMALTLVPTLRFTRRPSPANAPLPSTPAAAVSTPA